MKILNAGCPRADGFYMPAEYAPHKGTIIIWPKKDSPGLMDLRCQEYEPQERLLRR